MPADPVAAIETHALLAKPPPLARRLESFYDRQRPRLVEKLGDAGEPFEDLARSNSEDSATAPQGGDLGTLTRSQMPGDLGSAIFSMEEGAVEGPIETEFGFHIVRLDEIIEQAALLRIVRSRPVRTQTELVDRLRRSGHRCTQASVGDAVTATCTTLRLPSSMSTRTYRTE